MGLKLAHIYSCRINWFHLHIGLILVRWLEFFWLESKLKKCKHGLLERNFFLSLPSSFLFSYLRQGFMYSRLALSHFITKSDLQFLILLLLPFKYERQANFLSLLSSSSVSAESLKFKVCTMGNSYKASCCRSLTLGIETNAGPGWGLDAALLCTKD